MGESPPGLKRYTCSRPIEGEGSVANYCAALSLARDGTAAWQSISKLSRAIAAWNRCTGDTGSNLIAGDVGSSALAEQGASHGKDARRDHGSHVGTRPGDGAAARAARL